MKLSNRKPLFLALALTLAAPLAFAQSTDPQSSAQQATQAAQDAQTATQSAQDAAKTAQDAADATTTAAQQPTQAADSMAQQATGEPQKKNWSDLDINKNGTLSATEAASVQSLSSSFSEADKNADGELTQDEYKAFLETKNGDEAKSDSGT